MTDVTVVAISSHTFLSFLVTSAKKLPVRLPRRCAHRLAMTGIGKKERRRMASFFYLNWYLLFQQTGDQAAQVNDGSEEIGEEGLEVAATVADVPDGADGVGGYVFTKFCADFCAGLRG